MLLQDLASPEIARLVHIDGDHDYELFRRFLYEVIKRPKLGEDVRSLIFTRTSLRQTHRLVLVHIHRFPNLQHLLGIPLSAALFDDLLIPPPILRPRLRHLTIHQAAEQPLSDSSTIRRWLDLSALRILTIKGELEIPLDVSGIAAEGTVRDLTLMSVFLKRPLAAFHATLQNARHVDLEFTNLEPEDVQPLLYAAPTLQSLVLPDQHSVSSLARLAHRNLVSLALPVSVCLQDAEDFVARFSRKHLPCLQELAFVDLDLDEDTTEEDEDEMREAFERTLRAVDVEVDWLAKP